MMKNLKILINDQLNASKEGNNALDTILTVLCDRLIKLETNVANPAKKSVNDQAVQVMCMTDDGCQTEIAWALT
mgnify:CR=1 FL=1